MKNETENQASRDKIISYAMNFPDNLFHQEHLAKSARELQKSEIFLQTMDPNSKKYLFLKSYHAFTICAHTDDEREFKRMFTKAQTVPEKLVEAALNKVEKDEIERDEVYTGLIIISSEDTPKRCEEVFKKLVSLQKHKALKKIVNEYLDYEKPEDKDNFIYLQPIYRAATARVARENVQAMQNVFHKRPIYNRHILAEENESKLSPAIAHQFNLILR